MYNKKKKLKQFLDYSLLKIITFLNYDDANLLFK